MKRVSVTVPDELAHEVRRRFPDLNVSGLLQLALRDLLTCPHERLVCRACAEELDSARVATTILDRLYAELLDTIEDQLWTGGNVEGLAARVRSLAQRHNVRLAFTRPLPRLTRAEREARRDAAKDRHPSAGTPAPTKEWHGQHVA